MDLNELQSVRDRERQTDKLQQLRESFYADAGRFIQQLRAERDRAVERADDPFDSAEVRQLSDEIKTAQQTVEAIYEKRVGKIVKAASFAAADLPAEVDGMTAEEQSLFDNLVGNIKDNREHVLTLLDGDDPGNPGTESSSTDVESSEVGTEPPADTTPSPSTDRNQPSNDRIQSRPNHGDRTQSQPEPEGSQANSGDGVSAADVMGGGTPTEQSGTTQQEEPVGSPDDGATDRPVSEPDEPTTAAPSPEAEAVPPSSEPVDPPVRKDGGQETIRNGEEATQSPEDPSATEGVDRQRVQILEDVDTFLGFDDRDYDLESDDVVSLPATNADILLEQGVAREL